MTRSIVLITAILFSASAWAAEAQNSGMSQGTMGNDSMGHMSGGSMNHMASGQDCQGMMDEAKPKLDAMADSAMKTKAMGEMHMAEAAMHKGRMNSCVNHMHQAMELTR
ncbi:MAG TPA: hypothetical protein VMU01_05710 [Rhizomicrobium sp.]|nr:hypothetical protein [Rhizomicrobium sp.]